MVTAYIKLKENIKEKPKTKASAVKEQVLLEDYRILSMASKLTEEKTVGLVLVKNNNWDFEEIGINSRRFPVQLEKCS